MSYSRKVRQTHFLSVFYTGALLTQGRRTVAAALRVSGNSMAGNWSSFHQVLNRARWSPLAVSRQLLLLIVATFVPAGATVDLVIDETLERRWGGKISKRGHSRDSALSSRERSVSSPGLRLPRDGGGRHPPLDEAEMGVAVLVRAGDDPRSE
jgi:DDE superfamily endonuclease